MVYPGSGPPQFDAIREILSIFKPMFADPATLQLSNTE